MAKPKKQPKPAKAPRTKAPKPPRPEGPSLWARLSARIPDALRARCRGSAPWAALAVGVLVVLGVGFKVLESAVLDTVPPRPLTEVRVALLAHPDWMPPSLIGDLAHAVCGDAADFDTPPYTQQVHERALASPWIARVHSVTKSRLPAREDLGVVEVRCDYRTPLVRVQLTDLSGIVLVDREGVRLPQRADVNTDRLVLVQGVQGGPPPLGQPWNAPDLLDAIRLIELLQSRSYDREVTAVDVLNHGGRMDPYSAHIRFFAQSGTRRATEIRFGRFPSPDGTDYEIPPDRKLARLDRYVSDYRALSGTHRWIDIRYDQLETSLD